MTKSLHSTKAMTKKEVDKLFIELQKAFYLNCKTISEILKSEGYASRTRKWAIDNLQGIKIGLMSYAHIKDIRSNIDMGFDLWASHQIARLKVRWDNKFIEVD